MGIKLRTTRFQSYPIDNERAGLAGTMADAKHDAAVAHALVNAVNNDAIPDSVREWIDNRATEILRDEFGIEDKDNG